MTEPSFFFAAFVTVFALGFQQQNVTGRHYLAAVVTSLIIGASQFFLWRHAHAASASEIVATLLGGPAGIAAAMFVHPRITRCWKRGRA